MTNVELKKSLHNLIDQIENEHLLKSFYNILKSRISVQDGQLWDRLSTDEKEELLAAYDESLHEENLLSDKTMRYKHKKWL